MMTRRHAAAAILALLTLAPTAGERLATQPVQSGVIVESVAKGWEGERAGLRAGDVLISWRRPPNPPANQAEASGAFRTPFDVLRVNLEDAQRAPSMTFELLRGGKRISASLSQDEWRIETRPAFSGRRLASYEQGRHFVEQGKRGRGLSVWRALASELASAGEHNDAAWVWRRIGLDQAQAGAVDAGALSIDLALSQARASRRTDVLAQLLWDKAQIYANVRRYADGERVLRDALALLEKEQPDGLAVANALLMMNLVTEPRGALYEAQQTRALRILQREAPGSAAEADCLGGLSTVTAWRGDARTGAELELRALSIFLSLNPRDRRVSFVSNNLCSGELLRGDYATAEAYCYRALDIARDLGPDDQAANMAAPYHNLAMIAARQGDLDRAADLLRKAVAIREKAAPQSRGVAVHLQDLGLVEMRRGNLDEAEELIRRGLGIHRRVAQLNSPHEAHSQLFLAEIAYRRGDLPGAIRQLRDAAAFWQPLAPDGPNASDIYHDLGRVLAEAGDTKDSEVQFRHALAIRRRYSVASRETAESSHGLGMLLWKTGRLAEAETELRHSIEDLEAQLARLGGPEETRSAFAAEFADYYRDYLRLLVELRREEDAFLLLERYRAGSFLRLLAQRDLNAPGEVPADLEQRRRSANAEYERLQRETEELAPATQALEMSDALARLRDLRREQLEIADAIRKASPRYAELRYPRPLDLAGARAALEPGTLLLSYAVGGERSYLFAVSSNTTAGKGLAVFPLSIGERELRESVDAFRRLIARKKPNPEVAASSRALYALLVSPAETLISRSDRIVILPDGPLHRLPWSALTRGSGGREYLGEWKPLSTAASATVHAELKKARRGARDEAPLLLAAFGDPRYPAPSARTGQGVGALRGAGDEVGTQGAEPTDEPADLEDPQLRSVVRGGFAFVALPESRAEVEEIAAMFRPRANAYLGADATEERARSVGRDVPFIHYACHAVINGRFPLDSALVLSIPEHPREGQDNGLLQAWEIFERMRIDADLVTLSSCDSGLGKEMGGEGLIGLTRAFQYAGARSVLASLWKVDDKATSELMKRFYTHLKTGMTKDEALRRAQAELIRSAEFSQPWDWAAFQLNGDWK
jgi:CHAT domain-containing protein